MEQQVHCKRAVHNICRDIKGKKVYFVGIKGTGMTALAEIFTALGAYVTGSDSSERFYTDAILKSLSIPVLEGFTEENLPEQIDFAVYSAAYSIQDNPELQRLLHRKVPLLTYVEALGYLSSKYDAVGISGVHGKTTTAAMTGAIAKKISLPAVVLAGSGIADFNNRSTLMLGDTYFIAETCEYRRHFLHFQANRIVITSIEPDHLDYYAGYEDILSAFVEYICSLPLKGAVIYCADDSGAKEAAARGKEKRPDIVFIPYGQHAAGRFGINSIIMNPGETRFTLAGWKTQFTLSLPGRHLVLNAAAAITLIVRLIEASGTGSVKEKKMAEIASGLASFQGAKRRSEIIGTANGILFMDDYAHHPTEIYTTLAGLKKFYPNRRLIVDFMSHTYSRTKALLNEFAQSFAPADIVVLHKIYASAREQADFIDGRILFEETKKYHSKVHYFHEIFAAKNFYFDLLKANDLFITMGAGDNWVLSETLYKEYQKN